MIDEAKLKGRVGGIDDILITLCLSTLACITMFSLVTALYLFLSHLADLTITANEALIVVAVSQQSCRYLLLTPSVHLVDGIPGPPRFQSVLHQKGSSWGRRADGDQRSMLCRGPAHDHLLVRSFSHRAGYCLSAATLQYDRRIRLG